jgi:DNA-binding winged helix-turn-helix (wHTH) protein/tetratricopeptide (TPR) repeat protein
MTKQARCLYEFGPFRIDSAERLLLRDSRPVHITAKAFDTLLVLIQSRSHLVEKSDLMRAVWEDRFVEEGNLAVTISSLRKVLEDDGSEHKYIQTVPKLGYRFVGEVRDILEREPPGVHSLAVLPFRSLNPAADANCVRVRMADAIITRLGSTGQISVRPTTAVLQYAEGSGDPLAIGREEQVDAILVGQIETLSNQIRLTVQLIRVRDGSLLWADSYDKNPEQIFAVEDEVAQQVAESLLNCLCGPTKTRVTRRNTRNSIAHRLYLEGRYFWYKRTEEGLRRSIVCFERATQEDPHYALAFAGLADSYVLLGSYGVEPALQASPIAKSAALKALQLDNSLAEAHTSLGMVYFYYDWNWSKAEQEFQRAIELDPNYVVAHNWYALNLSAMGRLDEALAQVHLAEDLDPLSFNTKIEMGLVSYWRREYSRAIEAYRKIIDLDPRFARAHTRLGMTYAAERAFDDAIREFNEAQQLSGRDP